MQSRLQKGEECTETGKRTEGLVRKMNFPALVETTPQLITLCVYICAAFVRVRWTSKSWCPGTVKNKKKTRKSNASSLSIVVLRSFWSSERAVLQECSPEQQKKWK